MSQAREPFSILPTSECWDLLAGEKIGRLVTTVDGEAHIFPVNFVVDDRTVLFRTAEGTKLSSAVTSKEVLFEADDYRQPEGWSVIVKGTARSLRDEDEIADAEGAGLVSWPTPEPTRFVRIRPGSVTGRRFVFGSAPDA
ncbi:pyridoxamine 5'-phosphate oxidase family protein [Mycolicibacterium vaccae]|jgi:nitroimidazol reductase NimA-like FMN-containing flavoprotein (pyridoxamine 5'-phosphate oxidase superfamily)|uniref:Putative flavin-nucleotide-binding protein n=1 Tax=Mycolicibacterium vaccae ATCC 25954 TaxID=1194972 RepID=K0URL8_MYCVA|nr:pyridoxamine 5'-phosphate oxidase family protein [Mycolicibacterium vaccae]ANI37740.1 pyridoxamine 5'-phosphate oxidase [Mycolicibacterium vaccae 95051]EJZ09436.1 putative flavin-nucleotide-binding protein [Mycolicibacterium vaccae ATCC 25954]MCV7060757.1 pyridoxamine 5'-phosphate oxidase family protein [Mycolicibacterium vaccae]